MIPNNVGSIDSSYYSNPDNDGNIAIHLVNTTTDGEVASEFSYRTGDIHEVPCCGW